MLTKYLSFTDFGHKIEYRPLLYRANSKYCNTNLFMPIINNYAMRPISNRYTPIKTEDIVNEVIDILNSNNIKILNIKSELKSNKVMIVNIVLDKYFEGEIFEKNLLPEVARELDYSYKNVLKDKINMIFSVSNSYDGWIPPIGCFGFLREVCNNEILVMDKVPLDGTINTNVFIRATFERNIKHIEKLLKQKDDIITQALIKTLVNYLLKSSALKRGIKDLLQPYITKNQNLSLWTLYNLSTYIVSRSKTLQMDIRNKLKIQNEIFKRMV